MNLGFKISSCIHISKATQTHMMLIFLNAGSAHFLLKIIIIEKGRKKREFDMLVSDQGYIRVLWLVAIAVLYIYLAWDDYVSSLACFQRGHTLK